MRQSALLYVLIFSPVIHAVDFHHDIVSSLLNRTPQQILYDGSYISIPLSQW